MDVQEKLRELMRDHNINDDMLDCKCSENHCFKIEKFISWDVVGPRLPRITHQDINDINRDVHADQSAKRRKLWQLWQSRMADKATYRSLIIAMLQEERVEQATKVCKLLMPTKGSVVACWR